MVPLPKPSRIALTFVVPEDLVPPAERAAARIGSETAAARGEPWVTRCEAKATTDHLLQLGFRSVFHLTPDLAHERYFAGRPDQLPTPVMEQLLSASV